MGCKPHRYKVKLQHHFDDGNRSILQKLKIIFSYHHRKDRQSMGVDPSAWGLVMELTAYHTKLAYYKIIYIASDF
jgi:hypothetical protein